MAKKKKKSATKRAPAKSRKKTATRKKKRGGLSASRRKGFLSEMFSPGAAQASFKNVLSGGAGGAIAKGLEKLMGDTTMGWKVAGITTGAFVMGSVGRMPATAAGMAGAAGYILAGEINEGIQDGIMQNKRYANDIQRLPMFLGEDNQPLQLADAQSLADGEVTLADANGNILQPAYFPNFGGAANGM